MKITKIQIAGLGILVASIAAVTVLSFLYMNREALGSSIPGLPATIATSSNYTVGIWEGRVFATTTQDNCSSRVITTVAQPIMVTFTDAKVPTGTYGHLQAASTTEVYDSGLYGCHAWRIYGFNASTSITVTEFR